MSQPWRDFVADIRTIVLGELAVRRGLITSVQLGELLLIQEQMSYQRRLGQIMLDRGFVTLMQLDTLLAEQKAALGEIEAEHHILFGNLAIERGYVHPRAVADYAGVRYAISVPLDLTAENAIS